MEYTEVRDWVEKNFSEIHVSLLERAYKNCPEDIEYLAPKSFDKFLPMHGWVFIPRNVSLSKWIERNAERIHEVAGFIVMKTPEIGVFLGVDATGYDFFTTHWKKLYELFLEDLSKV